MRQIDFSVLIPTFNRSTYIQLSIFSVLRQHGVSFEIIVSDDGSTDDTRSRVLHFKDKRIRYMRNPRRLGTSQNFIRCMEAANGEYIFNLGDDDMLLDKDSLLNILKFLKKHSLGMAKIGTITYEDDIEKPYMISEVSQKVKILKPKNEKEILTKSIEFGLGFYSGLIFNNKFINRNLLKFDHVCYPDHMCQCYHQASYDLIGRYGIGYIPKYYIVSRLSLQLIPRYFDLSKHGRLFIYEPILLARKFLSDQKYENYKKIYLRIHTVLLPNIKYFTSYTNLFNVVKEIIRIDHSIVLNYSFIIYSIIALLPNPILLFIKKTLILTRTRSVVTKLTRIRYVDKIRSMQKELNKRIL